MIIDGRKIADEILGELAGKIKNLNKPLQLAAVLVGGHPGSRKFLELKKNAAEKTGISFKQYEFAETISTDEFCDEVRKISGDEKNSGVLVELPLPPHIDFQKVLDCIPPEKDVDVLSSASQRKFFGGDFNILPPAAEAVKIIFEKHKINPKGKKTAVFGKGILVGAPISFWLKKLGAKVFEIDEFTRNPGDISKLADIVISGVGKSGLITGDMVKKGAAVIDFGRDIDFNSVSKKAALVTPPVGGAGPLVVASVLKNLVALNRNQKPAGKRG